MTVPSEAQTLVSRWLPDHEPGDHDYPELLARLVSKTIQSDDGTTDWENGSAMTGEPRQFMKELVSVVSSREWTGENMKTFVCNLGRNGVLALMSNDNSRLWTMTSKQKLSGKWHHALNTLGAFRSTGLLPQERHLLFLKFKKLAAFERFGLDATTLPRDLP